MEDSPRTRAKADTRDGISLCWPQVITCPLSPIFSPNIGNKISDVFLGSWNEDM